MDQELSWAFEFFKREAREYQDIEWHSQARAFRAMLKGLKDPPFLKAVRHIHAKLQRDAQRERVFICLADTVAVWHPDRITQLREAYRRVEELNDEIAERAQELAFLMETRSTIVNEEGVGEAPGVGLWEALDEWANQHPSTAGEAVDRHLYNSNMPPEIESFQRHLLKHGPCMTDLVRALHYLCANREMTRMQRWQPNNVTAAAVTGRENSLRTFIGCLIERFDNSTEGKPGQGVRLRDYGMLPHGFTIGAADLAALLNVALERHEDLLTADNLRKTPEFAAWSKNRKIPRRLSSE